MKDEEIIRGFIGLFGFVVWLAWVIFLIYVGHHFLVKYW